MNLTFLFKLMGIIICAILVLGLPLSLFPGTTLDVAIAGTLWSILLFGIVTPILSYLLAKVLNL